MIPYLPLLGTLCDTDAVTIRPSATQLSESVFASHLARDLASALAFRPDDDAATSVSAMTDLQFDSAPVLEKEVPVGIFNKLPAASLEPGTTVSDFMRPLTASQIVSGRASLDQLMQRLETETFLFVVDNVDVAGFITPADLGTIPVRTYFYLRLAHLENLLSDYLRSAYSDQEKAILLLSPSRQANHAKLAEDLRSKDKFIDDFACLSLDDLVTLAGKEPNFRSALHGEGVGWRAAKAGLADFRNDIMHPSRPFTCATETRPTRLLARQRSLDALIRATAKSMHQSSALSGTQKPQRQSARAVTGFASRTG